MDFIPMVLHEIPGIERKITPAFELTLPALFLQKVVEPATSAEGKDILLLGALTTLSACFPKLYGIYDGKKGGTFATI